MIARTRLMSNTVSMSTQAKGTTGSSVTCVSSNMLNGERNEHIIMTKFDVHDQKTRTEHESETIMTISQ